MKLDRTMKHCFASQTRLIAAAVLHLKKGSGIGTYLIQQYQSKQAVLSFLEIEDPVSFVYIVAMIALYYQEFSDVRYLMLTESTKTSMLGYTYRKMVREW
jgi:hypothetical protein